MAISIIDRNLNVNRQMNWFERYTQVSGRQQRTIARYLRLKRALDILICLAAMPVLLPVLLLCAVLIKLDSPNGPVFFVQERTGKYGRRFKMFKFRTMVPNAEELKKKLFDVNADGELLRPLKLKNDPRITRIGRILRKTSLDELPQVLNILRGEMSWVGPRPTSFGLKSYALWHTERLEVTPGITGLWQLCSRGDTDFDSWLRYDVLYIQNRCLMLDVELLFRTAGSVFAGKGAH
jgi:lipopolysaccharide/colanic/teichoic acid biosynthesis glycosyltransferase